jgi:hypothetical protein
MILNGVMRRNRTAAVGDGELQGLKGGRDFRPLSACCWALLPGREENLASNKFRRKGQIRLSFNIVLKSLAW